MLSLSRPLVDWGLANHNRIMAAPFVTTRRVEFHDTDAAGIMHFSAFFVMMEQAEHELLRHVGLSVMMFDEQGKISWPRVGARCDYRAAVKFEDVMQIEVWLSRLGSKSATYNFRFSHEGRDVAEGEMTSVCCRFPPGGPPVSIAIPEAWAAKLRPWVIASS
jgi:acyl-CoA thioester hydrolase